MPRVKKSRRDASAPRATHRLLPSEVPRATARRMSRQSSKSRCLQRSRIRSKRNLSLRSRNSRYSSRISLHPARNFRHHPRISPLHSKIYRLHARLSLPIRIRASQWNREISNISRNPRFISQNTPCFRESLYGCASCLDALCPFDLRPAFGVCAWEFLMPRCVTQEDERSCHPEGEPCEREGSGRADLPFPRSFGSPRPGEPFSVLHYNLRVSRNTLCPAQRSSSATATWTRPGGPSGATPLRRRCSRLPDEAAAGGDSTLCSPNVTARGTSPRTPPPRATRRRRADRSRSRTGRRRQRRRLFPENPVLVRLLLRTAARGAVSLCGTGESEPHRDSSGRHEREVAHGRQGVTSRLRNQSKRPEH